MDDQSFQSRNGIARRDFLRGVSGAAIGFALSRVAFAAEPGGPPVSAPQRKGFGSLRIEQSFASYGETCFDFAAHGVRVELSLV